MFNDKDQSDTGAPDQFSSYTPPKIEFESDETYPDLNILETLQTPKNKLFFSTPRFVSSMIQIAECLRFMEREARNVKLKDFIHDLNQDLPNNAYIPLMQG